MDEEHVDNYMNSMSVFFSNLSFNNLSRLIYREGYPAYKACPIQYNRDKKLKTFYDKFFKFDDYKKSSKVMMKSARLVVIDYIATSYLESLIMNIPTIFFWNQKVYLLNNDNLNFFDDLVNVGICQTNPAAAAEFINNLGENIEQWWWSNSIQKARKQFLDKNIGDPEDAIEYYLSLLKE